MPELPEVETIARALRPCLGGRRIVAVRGSGLRLRENVNLRSLRAAVGRRVLDVRRRAKFLIVELEGLRALVLHLGMSGSCRICAPSDPVEKHEHVIWTLDDGQSWRFDDPRRFGLVAFVKLAQGGGDPAELGSLPPEPMGEQFTTGYLRSLCRGRKRPIKTLLMDHHLIAGVGNIYAAEALFRARIRPTRAAGRLTRTECERLHAAIREVLGEAIALGGTTVTDFRSVDGGTGRFQTRLFVYGRAGETCLACRETRIRHIVQGGRSTCYCPRCQK